MSLLVLADRANGSTAPLQLRFLHALQGRPTSLTLSVITVYDTYACFATYAAVCDMKPILEPITNATMTLSQNGTIIWQEPGRNISHNATIVAYANATGALIVGGVVDQPAPASGEILVTFADFGPPIGDITDSNGIIYASTIPTGGYTSAWQSLPPGKINLIFDMQNSNTAYAFPLEFSVNTAVLVSFIPPTTTEGTPLVSTITTYSSSSPNPSPPGHHHHQKRVWIPIVIVFSVLAAVIIVGALAWFLFFRSRSSYQQI